MSYEGIVEYLCEKGHYWSKDAYADIPEQCRYCGSDIVWSHAVDQTNGICFDGDLNADPGTTCWPLEVDHYEDRIVKIPVYKVPT